MRIKEIGLEGPTRGVRQNWGRLDCAKVRLSGEVETDGSVPRMCMCLNFQVSSRRPAVLLLL